MGLFGKSTPAEQPPSLGEAWQMLAEPWAAAVEIRDEHSVHVTGTAHGRPFAVDISSRQKGNHFLAELLRQPGRRNRVHRTWASELAVACANPSRLQGSIRSFVDVRDPAWDPRNFDPSHCRKIVVDAPQLEACLTASIRERLMSLWMDATIAVGAESVRLADEGKADLESGYMVGSILHQRPGPVLPLPDRAIAGPPFWIDLLCDIADTVDG